MNYTEITESAPAVLVEFFATWCIHCQRMAPIVADVTKKLEGKVKVVQLDIDKYSEMADAEQVNATPTFILYKNGKQVWRQAGEMPEAELLQAINSNLE